MVFINVLLSHPDITSFIVAHFVENNTNVLARHCIITCSCLFLVALILYCCHLFVHAAVFKISLVYRFKISLHLVASPSFATPVSCLICYPSLICPTTAQSGLVDTRGHGNLSTFQLFDLPVVANREQRRRSGWFRSIGAISNSITLTTEEFG